MSMLDIAKLGVSSSEGDGEGIIANEDDSTRCSRLLLILTVVEGRREGEGITIKEDKGKEAVGVEDKDGNTGVGSSGVREEVVGIDEGKDGSTRVGSSDVGEEVVGVEEGKDGSTGVGSSDVGEEVVGVIEGEDGSTGVGSSDVGEEVVGVEEGEDGSTGVGSSDVGEEGVGVEEGKDGSTGVGSSVATTDGDAGSDVMTKTGMETESSSSELDGSSVKVNREVGTTLEEGTSEGKMVGVTVSSSVEATEEKVGVSSSEDGTKEEAGDTASSPEEKTDEKAAVSSTDG